MTARPVLSFTLLGLGQRDETLFKSFVRLVDHRTLQQWHCASDASADVLVVADSAGSVTTPQIPKIVLGSERRQEHGYLCLPLHADELESVLNAVGAGVLAQRAMVRNVLPASEQYSGGDIAAQVAQLLRWPPTDLLATPARVRLATLMTGRPLSVAALMQRSGVPEQVIFSFLQDLRGAGLLRLTRPQNDRVSAAMRTSGASMATHGLIARIRGRLGLFAGQRA